MNTYTVEEAKRRHCPNKFTLEGLTVLTVAQGSHISYLSDFCIADRCMAWRWSKEKQLRCNVQGLALIGYDDENNCPSYKPVYTNKIPKCVECENCIISKERTGYCGLAGEVLP